MKTNFIQKETAICEYACNKYYVVDYNHNGYTSTVKGMLLNYYSGNIVLLSENGIYHMKYQDIIFMKPINISSLNKVNIEYKELLKFLQTE